MKPVEWFSREVTKHVRPVIRDFLIQVYENPENYLEPDQKEATNQLIKFQLALKKIPNWTNTQIKKQIDEIKDTNQFVIPEIIRHRYPKTYSINIFSEIKKIRNHEKLFFAELHNIYNQFEKETDESTKFIKDHFSFVSVK